VKKREKEREKRKREREDTGKIYFQCFEVFNYFSWNSVLLLVLTA